MFSLPTILLILAAISIGATVIAVLVAIRSAREARSAIFPIVREEETVRARRARVAIFALSALTALFLGGWLATLRLPILNPITPVADAPSEQPSESESIVFATVTPVPGEAAVVAEVPGEPIQAPPPIATATLAAAATLPPVATPTPVPPVPATAAAVVEISSTQSPVPSPVPPTVTPVPPTLIPPTTTPTPLPPTATPTRIAVIPTSGPRTPAPPGVKMGPIQFASKITPDIEAIDAKNLFPEGIRAVYAVYPYSGMVDGVDFSAVWYQNGTELWRDEQVWRWGSTANFYSFLNPPGNGLYKLDLYVNDTIVASGLFEIR